MRYRKHDMIALQEMRLGGDSVEEFRVRIQRIERCEIGFPPSQAPEKRFNEYLDVRRRQPAGRPSFDDREGRDPRTKDDLVGERALVAAILDARDDERFGLVAPRKQHDVRPDQILIDLNFLYMAKDKQSWFFTDPQIVIDNEADVVFAIVDVEFGVMMSKWTDLKGHSAYIRPSFGVGSDRPVDGSVEVGYKIVF